ncbi:hypothetical protein GE21DRAFT_9872 [Neurospora crassa]|uniref:Uncharacterized protein n=1 Tax=Neurospora crassa (strain ATCC 24698 / 74-OR23-1A / CBS 708.71 / DSM 1257 / FGSC 987) TaxID=367110 RepID=Q7S0W9_NEUCR|nr:hypothetical protein NCU06955 [Neurospora crassa OR74A]EAA28989.1 hypothetical protein NCU06955 [Neurospora crassa OR74A]KHE88086.1 hypothetical protein GE21DRAFT_9872 [Neurospora crassa]|eukprot:XP_958225.1 hypothetical protein NCU06955 [Neurospora crassa OR74A]
MSSGMGINIIYLIERIDRHPRNMPAIKRRGYAVEVVGIAMQGGCTADAVKGTVLDYIRVLRRKIDFASNAEEVAQLRHREILCGDIIATVCELNQKATIHKNVEVVVNQDALVDENDVDIDDFVHVHESSAEGFEAESADWELL